MSLFLDLPFWSRPNFVQNIVSLLNILVLGSYTFFFLIGIIIYKPATTIFGQQGEVLPKGKLRP